MNHQTALRDLQHNATRQRNKRIQFRDKVNLHCNYAAYLHGTNVWVRKQEWDKLGANERLDLKNYFDTRTTSDDDYTYAIPVPDQPIMLRLYRTDVVTWYPNGDVELACGGYETPTTRKWISVGTPANVWVGNTKPNRWTSSVWAVMANGITSRFYDGIRLNKDGRIISKIKPVEKYVPDKETCKEFQKAMKHFRKVYLPFVAMLEGGVPNELKDCTAPTYDWIGHILSYPTEAIPEIAYRMSRPRRYWRSSGCSREEFENTLRRLYYGWIPQHALVRG